MNIAVTYPINKVIFRQMLHGVRIRFAVKEIYEEGLIYLYRGALPPMCQKTISMALMFGVFDYCRKPLCKEFGSNSYFAKTIAALVAGTTEAVLMPLERIQTLLAVPDYHQHFKNTPHAISYIWKYHGFMEFYRGLVPILFRNGPSNAMFFILREEAIEKLPKHNTLLYKTFQEFFCGAFLGVICSTATYPLNVVKVSMQNQLGGPFQNFVTVLFQIYKDRGRKIRYIYHGLSLNCTRAFFGWGVMNTAYEAIKKVVYNI
uniref:Putative mitochondrial carrier protein n=1 Tax=Xenopsylla cheopis TaxID=163159 RepID=A0A6M2DMY4_XENCH